MELIIDLGIVGAFMTLLGIGGLITDYVLPLVDPLTRWIDSLPMNHTPIKKNMPHYTGRKSKQSKQPKPLNNSQTRNNLFTHKQRNHAIMTR